MHSLAIAFLRDLALVLGTAALTTVLFRAAKLPVALGYVLAGLVVGPHLPTGIDANPTTIATLSELGVTLLMFAVGLELSVSKILRAGSSALVTALVEVSLVFWLGYLVGSALGVSARESVFIGAALSISSTMLVAKTLDQASDPPLRQFVLGVLVIEDLLAILLLAVLTPLAGSGGLSPLQIGITLLKLFLFLAVALGVGLVAVPRAVRYVVSLGSPETTLVACIGFCFSVSLLAANAGFSVALGAFVAGALVAESGQSETIEHLVTPLKDMFAAIFLVSVGMQIDPLQITNEPLLVALLVCVVLVGKLLGVTLGGLFTGNKLTSSMKAGAALAQIGELSFIIAALGAGLGAFGARLYPSIVATSVLTALVAPVMTKRIPALALRIDRALPESLRTWLTFYPSWLESAKHSELSKVRGVRRYARNLVMDTAVICVWVAVLGSTRTRALPWLERHFVQPPLSTLLYPILGFVVAVPLVLGLLRNAQRLGTEFALRVLPAPEPGKLDLAASARRIFIVTLQLVIVSLVGLPIMAVTQPFLPPGSPVVLFLLINIVLGVSFMRSAKNFQGHVRAGAQVLLEAFAKHARMNEAAASGPSLSMVGEPADPFQTVQAVLPGFSNLTTMKVAANATAVGKSLRHLNLRGATGATVLGIRRKGEGVVPEPDDMIGAGDELILTGSAAAIDAAQRFLGAERAGS